MEYSLTKVFRTLISIVLSLNPCSNGILSDILYLLSGMPDRSLNPCSNGILSDSNIDLEKLSKGES